ncbi:hypothetical protein [Sporosarcina jiandibaonis]|uniref:hypothetical protein n=1 Tax=Sporosarcina jiandibaonis TaxID=2715535 RepID=UPI0015572CC5|nr:hypothetical protein [Sporosarcina jiandibaonis]
MMNTEKVDLKLKEIQCIVLKGDSIAEQKELFKDTAIKNLIIERSRNDRVFCLVCFDKDKTMAGYFWGIVPTERTWHDSIPIDKGQGFLFNGYVNPQFRGNNIFPFLINETSQYIKRHYQVNEIIDVVEKQNIASNKAHNKVNAKIYSKNILFKFLGRNLISLYRKNIILLLGNKRNRI